MKKRICGILALVTMLVAGVELELERQAIAASSTGQGNIFACVTITSTNPIVSDDFWMRSGDLTVTVYVFSTQAGVLQPVYIDLQGNARNDGAPIAINANELAKLSFARILWHSRYIFTPNAGSGTLCGDAFSGVR